MTYENDYTIPEEIMEQIFGLSRHKIFVHNRKNRTRMTRMLRISADDACMERAAKIRSIRVLFLK